MIARELVTSYDSKSENDEEDEDKDSEFQLADCLWLMPFFLRGAGEPLPRGQEFGWEETTARRFMDVHSLSLKSGNLQDLLPFFLRGAGEPLPRGQEFFLLGWPPFAFGMRPFKFTLRGKFDFLVPRGKAGAKAGRAFSDAPWRSPRRCAAAPS